MNSSIDIGIIETRAFVDLPAHKPDILLALDKVGVYRRPHYITVMDPFEDQPVRIQVELAIYSSLKADQKGLHMSRIENVLNQIDVRGPQSLTNYAVSLAQLMRESQEQQKGHVELLATYEKTVSNNPSDRLSTEILKLHADASVSRENESVILGVTAPFINACPCVQRWSTREFHRYLSKNYEFSEAVILDILSHAPRQSHTNGGQMTLRLHTDKISYGEIYDILGSSSPILRELLSGEDEYRVVDSASKAPLFCEDVARTIAMNTVSAFFNRVDSEIRVEIFVDVDESVHFHNLRCDIESSLGSLATELK